MKVKGPLPDVLDIILKGIELLVEIRESGEGETVECESTSRSHELQICKRRKKKGGKRGRRRMDREEKMTNKTHHCKIERDSDKRRCPKKCNPLPSLNTEREEEKRSVRTYTRNKVERNMSCQGGEMR